MATITLTPEELTLLSKILDHSRLTHDFQSEPAGSSLFTKLDSLTQDDTLSNLPQTVTDIQFGRIAPKSEIYVTIDGGKGDMGGEPFYILQSVGGANTIVGFPNQKQRIVFDTKSFIYRAAELIGLPFLEE